MEPDENKKGNDPDDEEALAGEEVRNIFNNPNNDDESDPMTPPYRSWGQGPKDEEEDDRMP